MNYEQQIHRLGRISTTIVLSLILALPLVVSLYFNIFPPLSSLFSGLLQALMIYLPISVAEYFSFVPMLGVGGSYLAFMTGNLTNLKIPCVSIALEQAKVKAGSEEAEIISTVSVAVSALTTICIVFLGLLLLLPLTPLLSSASIKPAFDNILPALFGALGAHFFYKQWKLAVVPVGVSILVAFLVMRVAHMNFSSIQGVLIPVVGAISLLSALQLYKRGWIRKEDIDAK